MIKDSDINRSIYNSMRSLFQMIAVVNDADGECVLFDLNRELENIPKTGSDSRDAFPFETLRRDLIRNIHPEDRERISLFTEHDTYVGMLKEHIFLSMECRLRHADNRYHWSEIIICNTTAEDSTEGNDSLFMIRDIDSVKTDQLNRERDENAILKDLQDRYDALFEENMTDQQTGCYNRKGLKHYTDIVIDDAVKNVRELFVCVADLNGLKHLNDTYGHAAGDEAIRVVSQELKNAAPSGSKVVRIGGDEFMIFASVDSGSSEPEEFGEKVDSGIRAYNASHSNPYEVGASYGWVLMPPEKGMINLDRYIEAADAKMYEMRVKRDRYRRD